MALIAILQLGMVASIILMLFGLALHARLADFAFLITHWRFGLGALVAMFVLVPATAILMARLFDLHPAVEVAMIALAFSPLPPVLPGKLLKAGGETRYVTGLLFGATVAAIILAPLGVALASRLFGVDAALSAADVAKPLAISILLPLVLGLLAAPLLGGLVPRVSDIAGKVGTGLLAISVLGLLFLMFPAMLQLVGGFTLLALAAMVVVGLIGGFLLGGPAPGNKAALALACSTRHPGVAIAIATHSLPDTNLVPAAVLLAMVVSTLLCIPFMRYVASRTQA